MYIQYSQGTRFRFCVKLIYPDRVGYVDGLLISRPHIYIEKLGHILVKKEKRKKSQNKRKKSEGFCLQDQQYIADILLHKHYPGEYFQFQVLDTIIVYYKPKYIIHYNYQQQLYNLCISLRLYTTCKQFLYIKTMNFLIKKDIYLATNNRYWLCCSTPYFSIFSKFVF